MSTFGQPRVGTQPPLGMEGREKQQVPPGRPIVDSNPLRWPALRSAGPHAVSLITLQEDICHWTFSLFSEKAGSGQKNKDMSLQNMLGIWVWSHERRELSTQGLGKPEDGAQRELNPHLSALSCHLNGPPLDPVMSELIYETLEEKCLEEFSLLSL